MAESFIKNYKSKRLHRDYERYSILIFDFQHHINRLCTIGLLSMAERNSHMKLFNDALKNLNTIYNDMIIRIKDFEMNDDVIDHMESCHTCRNIATHADATFTNTMDLVDFYKAVDQDVLEQHNLLDTLFWDPFYDIHDKVLDRMEKIGANSIYDILFILCGSQFSRLFTIDQRKELEVYNMLFVPSNMTIVVTDDHRLSVESIDPISDVLINTSVVVRVPIYDDKLVKISGYFRNDDLGTIIRTSQICNSFIHTKKKQIEKYIYDNNTIDDIFKKAYIKNLSITTVLSRSREGIIGQIDDDYDKYTSINKMTFINLMKEFTKDTGDQFNLVNMFDIIRLLLLGNDDHANIAGILFGIVKDKKVGSDVIANIIYNNLSYISQIRLKRTSINIRNELDKIKALSVNDVDLKKQIIACTNMPPAVRRLALEKIEEMKASNSEYYKQFLYVKTLLNYPWLSNEDDNIFSKLSGNKPKSRKYLEAFMESINNKVYGHKQTKELIKDIIAKWISNPSSSGNAIGLYGPPGVGKTLFAQAIGEALNIPFVQISLSGQNDGEYLHGHGYTYSGAQPGIIIKKMIEAGAPRCVMYFDEVDKATKKHDVNEIQNILMAIIDPNTNNDFTDRFFSEINFPLSKVLFIFSYNDPGKVDKVLKDRMEKIETNPYSVGDKINIAEQFSIKNSCKAVNFDPSMIKIDRDDIKFIIEEYAIEPGVRELNRRLDKILYKLNTDRIYQSGPFKKKTKIKTVRITRDVIENYLGKSEMNIQMIHSKSIIGKINGLFATDEGCGGIIPIQISDNYTGTSKKIEIKMTGRQGTVMQESVATAYTSAMNFIREDKRDEFLERQKYGLHVHTPSGAVPKDGPSAGAAFATAFVSRILNKKIKNTVAITSEIELFREITKIGGLQYKLMGAKKAGVELVLVTKENKDDIENIKKDYPELLDDKFKVIIVESFRDILRHTLVDYNDDDFIDDEEL